MGYYSLQFSPVNPLTFNCGFFFYVEDKIMSEAPVLIKTKFGVNFCLLVFYIHTYTTIDCTLANTHTHKTHTNTYTHTHTQTQTYTHIHIKTHTQTNIHTIQTHTHTHTHKHRYV